MEFRKYQHIMKLGTDEVDGILDGRVWLFYKIDGTNAQAFLKDDGTLGFGSRNREITTKDDNAGFALSVTRDEKLRDGLLAVLRAHPDYVVYGEWLVPHTLRSYANDAWRKFYVFDVQDESTGEYLPYPEYSEMLKGVPGLRIIPPICEMDSPTPEQVKAKLADTGAFLCSSGLGEGIVVKNYSYVNKYGRRTWAKLLTEDFAQGKARLRSENREIKSGEAEHATELRIANRYLTDEHIAKELSKMLEERGERVLDPRLTLEFLTRSFREFWLDNWEIILQREHMPTIDFKALRKICDARAKAVLARQ